MNDVNPTSELAVSKPQADPHPHPTPINIIVEVNGRNQHVKFDSSPVTGRQIREQAGASPSDDLTRLIHGRPSGGNIAPDDLVEIHDGDHFIALPTGTVS